MRTVKTALANLFQTAILSQNHNLKIVIFEKWPKRAVSPSFFLATSRISFLGVH